ncbi:uncharacterized protein LOC129218864 [Uloborus diversus]|uniref:uncharacterized protein LOC129218864 n=1 Tax=Uloborus diversus TaxID=327109 RepID=UPI002409C631|nr:uncharacterized protein LOC129218864 [Uloborus diversus]
MKVLTNTQFNALVTKRKYVNWTAEDISRSLVLRALSRKSYDYLRNKVGIPLPSSSTLKRWCSKFNYLAQILEEKFPDTSKDAIKIYSRARTFIRIRRLNSKFERDRKKSEKKMQKWIDSQKR